MDGKDDSPVEKKKKKGNYTRRKKRKCSFKDKKRPKKQNTSDENEQQCSSTSPQQQQLSDCSSRGKKISIDDSTDTVVDDKDYYVLMKFKVMIDMITSVGVCPNCKQKSLVLNDDLKQRMGLAHSMTLSCSNIRCTYTQNFCSDETCKLTTRNKKGRNPYQSNIRAVIGFRESGLGHSGMKNVMRCLNVHPISHTSFNDLNEHVAAVYETVATESMQKAASVVSELSEVKVPLPTCRVSLDGSWQKRGHASHNGVVTCISKGKCIDRQTLTKYCRECKIREKKQETPEYQTWYDNHKEHCPINHKGSSGAMESVGAVDIFCRSVRKNKLLYSEYLGDGDSSSFRDVVLAKPYSAYALEPQKLECVGHVQKRLGTRLRDKVKEYKGTKTPLGGRNKLTKVTMDAMQNWYGIAIRSNTDDIYKMKRAIGAILYHCTKFEGYDDEYRHGFCPSGKDSWCKYKKDKVTGKNTHKNKINLAEWIHKIIKPVFMDLSDEVLLSKCLHGETQNANEALNKIIWSKCPKTVFVERKVLEMGVNVAVIQYNDGLSAIENILKLFSIPFGTVTRDISIRQDRLSVANSKRKSSKSGKQKRKKNRRKAKYGLDAEIEAEPEESYVTGGF